MWSDGRMLNSMMDNVLASKLGRALRAASEELATSCGDGIDHGLIMLKHLHAHDFVIRERGRDEDREGRPL